MGIEIINTDPRTMQTPAKKITPGGIQPPTFDELPPRIFQIIRDREIKRICEEFHMTPAQLERYEQMAEQDL